jgi:hypothetical protein
MKWFRTHTRGTHCAPSSRSLLILSSPLCYVPQKFHHVLTRSVCIWTCSCNGDSRCDKGTLCYLCLPCLPACLPAWCVLSGLSFYPLYVKILSISLVIYVFQTFLLSVRLNPQLIVGSQQLETSASKSVHIK